MMTIVNRNIYHTWVIFGNVDLFVYFVVYIL
jgi:hypothetical protein